MFQSKDIKDRMVDALITAFIFAAALSWREALVKLLNTYLPIDDSGALSELIVTTIITVIVLILVYIVIKTDSFTEKKFFKSAENDNSK